MADQDFDVIVIGSGPGGYVCAIRAAQLGLKTACVEYEATLGGTCLNVGCIPSKALLQSSEHFAHTQHELGKHGIKVDNVTLDLPTLLGRKDDVVKSLTQGIAGLFKKNKVTWLKGRGSFVNASTVKVTAADGSTADYKTKHVVIATGSKPIEISPAKFDRKLIVSSTGALKLPQVPKHLIVIGGGVIGLEMGSVWMRLGAKVTVIEAASSILAGLDGELGKGLMKILQKEGMTFHLDTKLTGTKTGKDSVTATCQKPDGSTLEIKGDQMLVAVGRRANTEGLGLENLGVTLEAGGKVPVDGHLRTPVPNVWAIGDVIKGPMLAHKAEDEGIAVAEWIAGKAGHVNYEAIPWVVYTWPEIAAVGLSEEAAKEQGLAVKVGKFPFLANGRAKALGNTDGFVKIVADAKTDRIVGAHILGPNASELIAELAVAVEFGASAEDIARSTHAHPTLAECIKEAALGVDKRSIHI
ncbi:MAG: dihydrolipoyl dehydrogenase [Deltaproteobacteria bacterium]|nr:dihydrolipoyl dehydrogenase [Deltaproteobacteria bacterium]